MFKPLRETVKSIERDHVEVGLSIIKPLQPLHDGRCQISQPECQVLQQIPIGIS